MRNTKIPWCDATWNPVVGCRNGCEYCYARKIAERFGSIERDQIHFRFADKGENGLHVMTEKVQTHCKDGKFRTQPYPFGFEPTFLKYTIEAAPNRTKSDGPIEWKGHKNIFVCSMADLFGDWIPDEWIEEVFGVCAKAPRHRYMFLTKNPDRYTELAKKGKLPASENMYYGTTITDPDMPFLSSDMHNTFISIEPILAEFPVGKIYDTNWIIVGAETGNRPNKVTPKKEWIDNIVTSCRESGIPVFLKESLEPIMGELIQEYPWEK